MLCRLETARRSAAPIDPEASGARSQGGLAILAKKIQIGLIEDFLEFTTTTSQRETFMNRSAPHDTTSNSVQRKHDFRTHNKL